MPLQASETRLLARALDLDAERPGLLFLGLALLLALTGAIAGS